MGNFYYVKWLKLLRQLSKHNSYPSSPHRSLLWRYEIVTKVLIKLDELTTLSRYTTLHNPPPPPPRHKENKNHLDRVEKYNTTITDCISLSLIVCHFLPPPVSLSLLICCSVSFRVFFSDKLSLRFSFVSQRETWGNVFRFSWIYCFHLQFLSVIN